MKTIGLTGGIGTGKSTVGRMLTERHGVPVIDADQASRTVVEPGSPGLAAVIEAFGPGVATDGHLDRAAVRALIMADPSARKRLEGILHPLIFAEIARQLRSLSDQGRDAAVVEAALMVETGSYRMYDALIVVSASPDTQITRVMQRDGQSREAAERVLAAQLPLQEKEAVATAVIRNDGTLEDLQREVDACWERLGLG